MKNILKNKIAKLLANTGDMALKRRAINIVSGIDPQDKDKIIDIGCGDGYYLHLLSNLNPKTKLVGTDYDPVGLKKAKRNLSSNIKLYPGDLMRKLPFATNTFDKAVMSEVTEHLPSDVKGLKEVRRILKPGATLCLTVPNANYPMFWDPINWFLEALFDAHIKSGFFAGLWNQHIRLYPRQKIKAVVEKAGFKVIEAKSLTFWCLPFNHYIVNMVARLLASGNLDSKTSHALSKYTKNPKRPRVLNLAFGFVNLIDRLNDVYQPEETGVSVFVKAIKV